MASKVKAIARKWDGKREARPGENIYHTGRLSIYPKLYRGQEPITWGGGGEGGGPHGGCRRLKFYYFVGKSRLMIEKAS